MDRIRSEAARKRRRTARRLIATGWTPRMVAEFWGISRERVWQLLRYDRYLARKAAQTAMRNGTLVRPERCQRCRRDADRIEAHHPNHRDRFVVRWLCPSCHKREHR